MSLDLDLDQFHDHLSGTNISADDADSQDMDMNLRNNGQNQAEKRAHHNALERKRRDHIKGSFSDLRDVIPSLNGEKVDDADRLLSNDLCSFLSGVSCSRSQGSDRLHSIDQIEKSTAPEGDRRAEKTECFVRIAK